MPLLFAERIQNHLKYKQWLVKTTRGLVFEGKTHKFTTVGNIYIKQSKEIKQKQKRTENLGISKFKKTVH